MKRPLISGQLMVLVCPQPVQQVHREAESRDPQGILSLLPPGLPVGRGTLAAGAAELTDPAPLPFGGAFHRGREDSSWSRMKSELKILKPFLLQKGFPWAN